MVRLAISMLRVGLFAVVTHRHLAGRVTVLLTPRIRSVQNSAVRAEASSPESNGMVTLSITITSGACVRHAVILLRHSSPFDACAIMAIRFPPMLAPRSTSLASPFPVPGVGDSIE